MCNLYQKQIETNCAKYIAFHESPCSVMELMGDSCRWFTVRSCGLNARLNACECAAGCHVLPQAICTFCLSVVGAGRVWRPPLHTPTWQTHMLPKRFLVRVLASHLQRPEIVTTLPNEKRTFAKADNHCKSRKWMSLDNTKRTNSLQHMRRSDMTTHMHQFIQD